MASAALLNRWEKERASSRPNSGNCSMSAPAAKCRRPPVSTTARMSRCFASSPQSVTMSRSMSSLTALTFGRSNRRVATPGAVSGSRITYEVMNER